MTTPSSVKQTAGSIAALSLLLALSACGSGGPTPPSNTALQAPQNLTVIPADAQATIVWDAPNDSNVTGFNVYADNQKLNSAPLNAMKARALGGTRLSYLAKNLVNGQKYDFRVVSVGASGEGSSASAGGSGTPLVCEKYKVDSRLFASRPYELHRAKLTRGEAAIPGADVRVMQGGTTSSMTYSTSLQEYFDNTSGAAGLWAPGSRAELLIRVGDCLVLAYDNVPARPSVTTPATGSNYNTAAPLTLNWTLNAADPPQLNVHAAWTVGGVTGVRMFDNLPGSARAFTIPAGSIPANAQNLRVWVRASSPGTATFYGANTPDSTLGVDNTSATISLTTSTAPANPPAVSWGDPHLMTLDQTAVEFMSVGEFDLSMGNSDTFRVQARQRPFGSSTTVSSNTAIATRMNGQKVGVYLASRPNVRVGDAGTITAIPAGGLDLGGGYRITQSSTDATVDYLFHYPGGEELKVVTYSSHMSAYLTLPDGRRGAMKGLWGNFDGNTSNDLFLRNGTALSSPIPFAEFYGTYANSWRIPSLSESLFVYDSGESFGGFDDPNFPSALPAVTAEQRAAASATCTAAGVTNPINLEGCIIDVSQTGDNAFAKAAATAPAPAAQVTITPPAAAAKPDLVVKDFSVALGQDCRPYSTFVTGTVTIKNVGTGPSPAMSDIGLAQVVDVRDEALGAGYRGNGVGLPALAPGESTTVTVPVYYPIETPQDTAGTRNYFARVDFGHHIPESDETNNRSGNNASVTIPAGFCKNKVALVHTTDTSAANVYKTELTKKGLNVTLVNASGLTPNRPADLAGYDLIAIDALTGDLDTWNGGNDAMWAIQAAKKPMLGLGGGGYAFFGKINYALGYPRGASGSTNIDSIRAPATPHTAMQTPFPVNFTGELAKISNMPERVVAYHIATFPTLETVGLVPEAPDFRMPAVEAKTNTAQWPFYGVPNYTADGWNSVANLAWYLLR